MRSDASKGIVDAGLTLVHPRTSNADGLLALMLSLNIWRKDANTA